MLRYRYLLLIAVSLPALAQPAVDVTAVTTSDGFLLELGQALGGQASIRPVDSLEAALPNLTGGKRAHVLVLDSIRPGEARAALDAAHARAPQAVVLMFAAEGQEKQVAAAVKGSNVFAVLPTPVDARKTQAVFAGVIEEALARKAAVAAPPAAAASENLTIGAFRAQPPPAVAPPEGGGKGRVMLIAAAVAVLVLAGGAFWFLSHGTSRSPSARAPAAEPRQTSELAPVPAADLSIVHGKVDELLEKARLAMRERRYTEPSGDNALLYYRSAAAAAPTSGEARDGLQRVATVLAGRFDEALGGGRLDEAALVLANFKAAAPGDPRGDALAMRLLTAQVTKALADGNFDHAAALLRQAQQSAGLPADELAKWRTEIARRQEDARVQRLAGLVQDRIRDGKLTDPSDDNAKLYLRQLATSAPGNPNTERAERDLIAAYLRKAHDAALARNSAEEDRWLNEARGAGLSNAEIAAFQRDVAGARAKAAQADGDRMAQTARERIRDGRLTDPAQDSAAWYLTQLQSSDPTNSALAPASHELAGKLIDRARAAAQAGKSPDQELAQARHWGADPKDILAVQQLAAPKPAAASVDPATLAGNLKAVRSVPPEYPQSALQRGISGSVLLSYTVDVNGATKNIQVVQSSPSGVFDHAAVGAVRHWRYAPMVVNGSAVEVPTRTLVRFELPK
jgi:TonB family protein